MFDVARGLFADQLVERGTGIQRAVAEDLTGGAIDAHDLTVHIEGQNGGGNIFENGFDERAPLIDLLHGLLQAAGEFLDLLAVGGQLHGHLVERAHQRAQFVAGLDLHLRGEVAGADFAGGFGQRLDGHGDAARQMQRRPGRRK